MCTKWLHLAEVCTLRVLLAWNDFTHENSIFHAFIFYSYSRHLQRQLGILKKCRTIDCSDDGQLYRLMDSPTDPTF